MRRPSRWVFAFLALAPACGSAPPPTHEALAQESPSALPPAPVSLEFSGASRSTSLAVDPASSHRRTCPPAEVIHASHILVTWGGALRAPITEPVASRTKEQALARIREVLAKARAGADFTALAKEYSDDQGTASRGGSLGRFSKGQMIKPFADASFALCPGELSDVVETDFGYHLVLRTE